MITSSYYTLSGVLRRIAHMVIPFRVCESMVPCALQRLSGTRRRDMIKVMICRRRIIGGIKIMSDKENTMKTFRFFAGTHASAGQDSLCLCEADFKEAAFTELYTMREISDPTYLALSPDRILYTFGKTAAGVSVYAIREQAVISSLPCASGGPCHISVDERGEFLLVAGYGSGTVSLYDLNTDGSIRSLCDSRQYRGVGFDSEAAFRTAPVRGILHSATGIPACFSCSRRWPTRSSLIDIILKVTNTYLCSRSRLSATAHPAYVLLIRLSCCPPRLTMEASAARSASRRTANISLSPAAWAIKASPCFAANRTESYVLPTAACVEESPPEISTSSKMMTLKIRTSVFWSPIKIRTSSQRCDSIAELKSCHFWT